MPFDADGPIRGMPLPTEWLEELHFEVNKDAAKELLTAFNSAAIWLKFALDKPEDDMLHDQAHVIVGLTDTLVKGSLLIAQMETAKHGELGIEGEILETVQRSMFAGLILAGIRFGQNHPEGFLEFDPRTIAATLAAVLEELVRGGEAEDSTDDED